MIPIWRGQRELIIEDRQTDKTLRFCRSWKNSPQPTWSRRRKPIEVFQELQAGVLISPCCASHGHLIAPILHSSKATPMHCTKVCNAQVFFLSIIKNYKKKLRHRRWCEYPYPTTWYLHNVLASLIISLFILESFLAISSYPSLVKFMSEEKCLELCTCASSSFSFFTLAKIAKLNGHGRHREIPSYKRCDGQPWRSVRDIIGNNVF